LGRRFDNRRAARTAILAGRSERKPAFDIAIRETRTITIGLNPAAADIRGKMGGSASPGAYRFQSHMPPDLHGQT
jgi:hypothetical protein